MQILVVSIRNVSKKIFPGRLAFLSQYLYFIQLDESGRIIFVYLSFGSSDSGVLHVCHSAHFTADQADIVHSNDFLSPCAFSSEWAGRL